MRHVSSQGTLKAGLALHFVAMAMLLCLPHLPLLARALAVQAQPGQCAMDHRICGCAPERVASRTCCCFRNMKTAETSVEQGHCGLQAKCHENPDLDNDTPPASHRLSSLPCGQDPRMITHVKPEIKYLRSARLPLPKQRSAPCNMHPLSDTYLNPSLEPPVPPPKMSAFA